MTNEEKELLVAYLIDAGDIDPDGDVEGQFLDWYRVREGMVPGEVHYKAILDAARVRERELPTGLPSRRWRRRACGRPDPRGLDRLPRSRLRPRRSLWLLRRRVRGRPGRGQGPSTETNDRTSSPSTSGGRRGNQRHGPGDRLSGSGAAASPCHPVPGCNGGREHWRCGPHDPR